MPTVEVDVSPHVLRWALNRSGKESAIEEKFPQISEWLSKKSKPTLRQLEELAKVTYTPLGYFFLPEPPEDQLPVPYFRTANKKLINQEQFSINLIETVQTMKLRQDWMREYLIEQGQEPLPFVNSAKLDDNPYQVAKNIRKTLNLENGWASNFPSWTTALRELQKRMENVGIIVVVNGIVGNNTHRKLNPEEFRGFVLVDEYAPLVFVNGADAKAAQMFTLAHELAHLWFGKSAAFDLKELQPANDKTEQICNIVAAEFLVPEDEFQQIWPDISHESEPYQILARFFKVSELVVARRALDLGYITKDEFIEFYNNYQAKEHSTTRDEEGGNFYATQNLRIGRRFAEAVISAVREGKLLYREAYRLTGLYGDTFDKYAELLGFGGPK
ncbi:ImmA/IrrE family metallo-endopeptidase [Caldanaerobacter sp.]|uniref:ImmA/IrrE family metallo-endopeptidase n=1 Tax=Caldanaerobacter sp. TaxID=2930036 RepID=UPI003C778AF3